MLAPLVLRNQLLLNEPVEPVQIDIGHDGRGDPALWRAGKRGVPLPVLQVPGLEHPVDQLKEPAVVDVLGQGADHDLVIERTEAVRDVTLDEPLRPAPAVYHFAQRGVAAPAATEPVGTVGKTHVVVRI